jgi:EmrB/QacA subfamily drug resistance transporter
MTGERHAVSGQAGPDSAGGQGTGRLDRATLVIAGVVMLGMIMAVLDTTVVNVALDTLSRDLHASLPTVQWVVTGYLLALGLVMPVTGWAVDRFGAKRCWMASIVLFIAGSALSGAAWSIGSLIGFRLLQGAGGGMLMPTGQAILAQAAGPKRMGRVMSLLGVPLLLGPVAGPILGGVLVQDVSWHWIFYINVPIAAAALALAARLLPAGRARRPERLNVPGLVLASAGLASLIYGLSEAGTKGGFGYPQVYGWMAGGVLLLGLFTTWSLRRGSGALIDLRLFTNRHFSAATATSFLVAVGLFGAMLLLPLYYQAVRGQGALNAGLLLVPQGLGAAAAMFPAGRLTDKLGARPVVLPGIALALAGTYAFTQVTATSSYTLLAAALFVRGLGLGATMMPAMAAAYATMSRAAVPRATTAINILRQIGGSLGTALMAVVLADQIRANLPAVASSAGLGRISTLPAALRAVVAPHLASAFGSTFWVAFALTAAIAVPVLFLPAGAAPSPAAGAPETPLSERVPGG